MTTNNKQVHDILNSQFAEDVEISSIPSGFYITFVKFLENKDYDKEIRNNIIEKQDQIINTFRYSSKLTNEKFLVKMNNKIVNINNEIEDGEIFSSSDNDDACEILQNNKNTSKTTQFLPNVVIENNVAGVNKKFMEKSNNNRVDRKRTHERNSMNINITDEKSQQYIFDDDLNIFVRGGSPPIKNLNQQNNYYDSKPQYYDEISCDSEDNFDKYSMYERKKRPKYKKNKNGYDKYRNKHKTKGQQRFKTSGAGGGTDNNDQFKRNKLCKFFLHNKCFRPSQCVFMHGEFPCKYYYLGLKCPDDKNCKLDHGKPLKDDMKEALLLHIQLAPDECLGNFQKIPCEVADKLFADRAMELKLNEIQLSKIKLDESSDHKYDTNKEKCHINDLKDEEFEVLDDTNIGKIQNSNHDILDDNVINIPIIKDFLNSDMYRICLEDELNNDKNVEALTDILPKENKIENLPILFNDIDERMKENLKKSIQSENYDDPNFKFFMIQFFLSLNHNKTNLNFNDIPQTLNIENYKEYLTEIQIGKLKELGINFVHHLSLLSLANLNSLGISITQISQIQDKSLTNENVNWSPPKKIVEEFDTIENQTESFKDNCTHVSSTSVDTDMRILPPVYSPDKWSGILDTDCRVLSPSLDETQNDLIVDEESELIIDESILSDSCDDDDLIFLQAKCKLENLINDNFNKKDPDSNDNLKKDEKANELLQQHIDFKPTNIKTVLETNDYDTIPELPLSPTEISFTHLIEQNMKKEYNGDMDMRFPFVPMVDFLPATEINGSVNLHDEIEYKINEILIPEKKPLPSSILVKLEPNHPDPRLRKEYFNREHSINNKKDFTIENTKNISINNNENINNNYNMNENNNNTNLNNEDMKIINKENINIKQENLTINNDESIKFSSKILGIDPRKRFEIQSPPLMESISIVTKNMNQLSERNKIEQQPSSIQFLHYYLQKSHWYNDQNSKRKIEINELIAFLARSIKNYHQGNIPNKQFNILNLYCAQKINEILINLGIDIDCNGYIIEINRLKQNNNNNQHEQLFQELNNNDQNNLNNAGIEFMYNQNSNIINNNIHNNQLYPMRFFKPPPLIPPLISMPPLSSVPKPGLLGFAPGIPCTNSNINMPPSFWCPSSPNYYPNNAQDPSYMMKSHHSNFQQKIHTNLFQRNHRKMNDRI